MQVIRTRPKLTVTGDGTGVVAYAGTRLLADLADATGLTHAFSDALLRDLLSTSDMVSVPLLRAKADAFLTQATLS